MVAPNQTFGFTISYKTLILTEPKISLVLKTFFCKKEKDYRGSLIPTPKPTPFHLQIHKRKNYDEQKSPKIAVIWNQSFLSLFPQSPISPSTICISMIKINIILLSRHVAGRILYFKLHKLKSNLGILL